MRGTGATSQKVNIVKHQAKAKTSKGLFKTPQVKSQGSKTPQKQDTRPMKECWYCGKKHKISKDKSNCPAWGKTCSKCGHENHF